MSQSMEALAVANEVRVKAGEQRRALTAAPVAAVVDAVINPPSELATLRLRALFLPRGDSRRMGLIPRFGRVRLQRAFDQIVEEHPLGRLSWHEDLCLRDLSEAERRRLARALVAQAPSKWRAGA